MSGEAVLVNLKTGNYYSLDPIGTTILNLLKERTPQNIINEVRQNFPDSGDEVVSDTTELLSDLLTEGIIEPAES